METILKKFMLTPAPSGYEKEMAYAMKEELEKSCDEVELDNFGNVIGHIKGNGPKVMVFGHMDQLGFIVRKIEKDGFIQVDRLGGIPEKVLPGLRLLIRTENGDWVKGVFGPKAHHASSPEDKYKVDFVTSLFIDVGAKSDEEVKKMGIFVGCPVIYNPSFEKLANGLVTGTAVDNRGSCAVLVKLAEAVAKQKHEADVYIVGTVWEEFNIRGGVVAARAIQPDIAIALDVTLAGDTHDLSDKYETALGAGPCVNLYSFHGRGTLNGTLPHEPLYKEVKAAAEKTGIQLQRYAGIGLLTDMAYVQMEGKGLAALEMGFPARYTHTPVEACNVADLIQLKELLAAAVCGITKDFHVKRF